MGRRAAGLESESEREKKNVCVCVCVCACVCERERDREGERETAGLIRDVNMDIKARRDWLVVRSADLLGSRVRRWCDRVILPLYTASQTYRGTSLIRKPRERNDS